MKNEDGKVSLAIEFSFLFKICFPILKSFRSDQMEIEDTTQGYQLSHAFFPFGGAVRALSVLDEWMIVGSTDKSCRIYKYNTETKKYDEMAKTTVTEELIFTVHITKTPSADPAAADDLTELSADPTAPAVSQKHLFLVAGKDKAIHVLDYTGKEVHCAKNVHEGYISDFTSNESSQYVVTGSWDASAKVWDKTTWE